MTQRYEELRRFALGDAQAAPAARGLALLVRSGLAEWMRAWASCATEACGAPLNRTQERRLAAPPSELVTVLAQMAMAASAQVQKVMV